MNNLLQKLIDQGVEVGRSPERFEELVCSGDFYCAVLVSLDNGYSFQTIGTHDLNQWGYGYDRFSYADWARRQGTGFCFLDLG